MNRCSVHRYTPAVVPLSAAVAHVLKHPTRATWRQAENTYVGVALFRAVTENA